MEFIEMIGITKKGELVEIQTNSAITGHQFVGLIITDPSQLSCDIAHIANHFYCKDPEQLQNLTLDALHTNQNRHHLLNEQL